MDQETYISDRVDDQIDWYDRKSQTAQKKFKMLRGFEIVAAAAIPLIAGFGKGFPYNSEVLGLLGACIAIASAIINLNQYQENWTGYRTTCETLKHEKYLFLTGAEPYREENAFQNFVRRVEMLISTENSNWSQNTRAAVENSDPGAGETNG